LSNPFYKNQRGQSRFFVGQCKPGRQFASRKASDNALVCIPQLIHFAGFRQGQPIAKKFRKKSPRTIVERKPDQQPLQRHKVLLRAGHGQSQIFDRFATAPNAFAATETHQRA